MALDYIWLTDKLKGEYKEAFDKVELYANLRNVDEDTKDDMLMELLDLFLTAQKEGKPVRKLIGSDLETFCNSYFETYSMKSYLRSLPQKLYQLFWVVFALEWIFYFTSEEEISLLHGTVDISGYVCGILVGVIVGFLCNVCVRPFMFRWKWLTSGRFSFFVLMITVGMIVAGVTLMDGHSLELSLFGILLVSGIYIFSYIVVRSIWRYRRYGSIRKEKSAVKTGGLHQLQRKVAEELPKEMVRRFHKKNEKRQKKGKEQMTPEEYMEQLRRENIGARKGDYIAAAITLLIVIGIIVRVAFTSTVMDTLIFIVVIAVAEIPAMALFRFSHRSVRARERLVEECDRRGITILEYAREREENDYE